MKVEIDQYNDPLGDTESTRQMMQEQAKVISNVGKM